LEAVVLPSTHDGRRAPGFRFGDPRTMALLACVAAFAHVFAGLTNKALRARTAPLWRAGYSSPQATYDLRRLRLKGFIERIPGTHTYRATPEGLLTAAFSTHLAGRVVVPALTDLAQPARPQPPVPRPLAAACRSYEKELESLVKSAHLAA
jgi:hypothetical protein